MSYLSSTRKLANALNRELPEWRTAVDELHFVGQMILDLSNQAYADVGDEGYRRGSWPAPKADLMVALMRVVQEREDDYARYRAAHGLVRYGCREAGVMEALHPWDRLMFTWQTRGYTVGYLVERLAQVGLSCQPSAQGRELLERRLNNPLDQMGDPWGVTFSLLEGWAVFQSLQDIGFSPEHDGLFSSLCKLAQADVSEVSQCCGRQEVLMDTGQRPGGVPLYSSAGAQWIVSYRQGDQLREFTAEALGTWMDVPPVVRAFDGLMAEMGRPERAFQFAPCREGHKEFAAFVVAPVEPFRALAAELGLPLMNSAEGANT